MSSRKIRPLFEIVFFTVENHCNVRAFFVELFAWCLLSTDNSINSIVSLYYKHWNVALFEAEHAWGWWQMHVLTLPALPLSCPVLPVLPLSCLSVALFFLETCYSKRWVLQFLFQTWVQLKLSWLHSINYWYFFCSRGRVWWQMQILVALFFLETYKYVQWETCFNVLDSFHNSYFCSHGAGCWQMRVLTLPVLPSLAQVFGERWVPHFF